MTSTLTLTLTFLIILLITNSHKLGSNELTVLESLHTADEAMSQRELARRTGLSVGLINAVIKKLVSTGYVKTSQLNRRSLDYLLTPQGFAQTAMRSYHYVLDTVRSYKTIHRKLETILDSHASAGVEIFYLYGDGELSELISMFFERGRWGVLRRGLPYRADGNSVVLNTSPTPLVNDRYRVVNLVSELGEKQG